MFRSITLTASLCLAVSGQISLPRTPIRGTSPHSASEAGASSIRISSPELVCGDQTRMAWTEDYPVIDGRFAFALPSNDGCAAVDLGSPLYEVRFMTATPTGEVPSAVTHWRVPPSDVPVSASTLDPNAVGRMQSISVEDEIDATQKRKPVRPRTWAPTPGGAPTNPELSTETDGTVATTKSADVFVKGKDGYNNFRIPSLLRTQTGRLIAFAEGRTAVSDQGNIDTVYKVSDDNGATWSGLSVLADLGANTIGNPTSVQLGNGTILVLLTSNVGTCIQTTLVNGTCAERRRVWVVQSNDNGVTWSALREITEQASDTQNWYWYATGPGNGIQMRSGRIVIPCDHTENPKSPVIYGHVLYSDDGGKTWAHGDRTAAVTDESTVVELDNRVLLMNSRYGSVVGNFRYIQTSSDGGKTWTNPHFDYNLPDPCVEGSQIRLALPRCSSCQWLLFSNPADINARKNLAIRMSTDGGATYRYARILDPNQAGYSALVQLTESRFGVLYENGTKSFFDKISFATFNSAWLQGK